MTIVQGRALKKPANCAIIQISGDSARSNNNGPLLTKGPIVVANEELDAGLKLRDQAGTVRRPAQIVACSSTGCLLVEEKGIREVDAETSL